MSWDADQHAQGAAGFLSPFGPYDRTDYWANTVDATTMANANAIQLVDYYDLRDRASVVDRLIAVHQDPRPAHAAR